MCVHFIFSDMKDLKKNSFERLLRDKIAYKDNFLSWKYIFIYIFLWIEPHKFLVWKIYFPCPTYIKVSVWKRINLWSRRKNVFSTKLESWFKPMVYIFVHLFMFFHIKVNIWWIAINCIVWSLNLSNFLAKRETRTKLRSSEMTLFFLFSLGL